MAGTSVLAQLAVQISANTASFNKSMKDAEKSLTTFTKNFQSAATAVGIGLGVSEISRFVIEATKLAGQAEAVRTAFERIPQASKLMAQLKEVTRGTVSEFELMKSAIKASNFGIELSQLPKLLQFATLRAQQTGQSVDYLVESIIMGIGRKSPMILDNLGISLVRLREKLGGVGSESASVAQMTQVVGDIASEELQNMAGFATTAATKMDQITASWNDLKIKIGENLQQGDHYNDLLENLKNQLIVWNSSEVGFWTKLFSSAKEYQQIVADIEMKQRIAAGAPGYGAITPTDFFANQAKQLKAFGEYTKNIANPIMDEKQLEELLKAREYAFKRYGESFRKISKATMADLAAYEKVHNKEFVINTKRYQQGLIEWSNVVNSNTPIMTRNLTAFSDALKVIDIPKMIGRPEDIDFVIQKLKNLGDGFETAAEKAKRLAEEFRSNTKDSIDNAIKSFVNGFEDVTSGDISFGENILNAIAEFARQFGQALITLGLGKLAFDKLIKNFMKVGAGSPLAAIAAGGALYALAGVLKNQSNKLAENRLLRNSNPEIGNLRNSESASIQISGTLTGSGRELVAVLNNTYYDNKVRKGG